MWAIKTGQPCITISVTECRGAFSRPAGRGLSKTQLRGPGLQHGRAGTPSPIPREWAVANALQSPSSSCPSGLHFYRRLTVRLRTTFSSMARMLPGLANPNHPQVYHVPEEEKRIRGSAPERVDKVLEDFMGAEPRRAASRRVGSGRCTGAAMQVHKSPRNHVF